MAGSRSGHNEMRNRSVLTILAAALLLVGSACNGLTEQLKSRLDRETNSAAGLDSATVTAGLREALEQGSARAVQQLGRNGGFWSNPRLRIPVPENLQRVDAGLRRIGQSKLADDFVHSLNRAAEQATPAARAIFVDAIRRMTVHDAIAILRGPPDAATQYFRRNTESQLTARFLPIVSRSTQAVGVTSYYKRMVQRAEVLGVVDTSRFDIDTYVTRQALDGLFALVAEEERRIREDPVARTTALLRKVFG
jgi:Protein of unknown function (DUF4197)